MRSVSDDGAAVGVLARSGWGSVDGVVVVVREIAGPAVAVVVREIAGPAVAVDVREIAGPAVAVVVREIAGPRVPVAVRETAGGDVGDGYRCGGGDGVPGRGGGVVTALARKGCGDDGELVRGAPIGGCIVLVGR